MSKHSHISAIFDNAFQSRAGSPDIYMSMSLVVTALTGENSWCTGVEEKAYGVLQYLKTYSRQKTKNG